MSTTTHSILFKNKVALRTEPSAFFVDLNLNQVIDALTSGKEEYNLKPFFYTSLNDTDAIIYRQEIMKDIENAILFDKLQSFAKSMRSIRLALSQAEKCAYKYQKERMFLDAVETYCDAIHSFADNISHVQLHSSGFLNFREYLTDYIQSTRFTSLLTETNKLIADLTAIKYCILTKELRVQVIQCNAEPDYSKEVDQVFEKFKQEPVKDYRVTFESLPELNHVEAAILDGVVTLYPAIFQSLDKYCADHVNFVNETLAVFDREVQFYIAWLEYIATLKKAGLQFCYPQISQTSKEVYSYKGFDIALAYKLVKENASIVCNDFNLAGRERIIIISGPNQGGKTTFARTFAQLHYLASLGCSVPGRQAKLFLFDKLLTHFEKEEDIAKHRSKFEDDVVRLHEILNEATPNSIIIMNEILSSTTLQDAIFLSKKLMEEISRLDILCVWVTFIDELVELSDKTASMVSTIVPENPAVRTFKVIKKPADGLAYALSIAEKYHVTYHDLIERIKS